jgi:hypothetical protein
MWLPIAENPGELRKFSLLTLLPKMELEDAVPYIQLGAQFLREYEVQVALDGSPPREGGHLRIP